MWLFRGFNRMGYWGSPASFRWSMRRPCLRWPRKDRKENAGRRRLGTAIWELVLTVERWVKKGRQFHFSLGRNNPLQELWERISESLRSDSPQSASPL